MPKNKISGLLRSSVKSLYKQYKNAGNGSDNRWLEDNYYIFERESKALYPFLKSAENTNLKKLVRFLFSLCLDACKDCVLPTEDEVGVLFGKSGVSIAGYSLACDLFKCSLIIQCAKSTDENAVEKTVKSLSRLEEIDFEKMCSKYCEAERLMCLDKIYSDMPEESRVVYRKRVFLLAKKSGKSEEEIIKSALEKNRHIGFSLLRTEEDRNEKYILFEILLAVSVSVSIALLLGSAPLFFLLLLPVWQITDALIFPLQMRKNPPRPLLRVESDEVFSNAKTLVTVSALLPPASKINEVEKHLTELYAANRDDNIGFCLLADKKVFSSAEKPDDRANTDAAKRMIKRLNEKYNNRFILLVRSREYSKTGREYTGKNRKMGAVGSLIKLLRDEDDGSFEINEGNRDLLENVKYILALDSDTSLPFSACRRLVSVAEHPLNKAVIDREKGIVRSGFAVFAPKIETRVLDESDTLFSSLLSGSGGVTAYDNLSCDRYRDVFGSGAFAGKGLIDVNAYHELLVSRFRDERILSHDIIEGEFLRTLFVSDTEVEDSFPKSESAFLSRLNRWVRGDWQNLPFLFAHPSVFSKKQTNPLSAVSKYKLFENLRRSLCPAAALLSILLSVLFKTNTGTLLISAALLSVSVNEFLSFFRALFSGGINMLSRLYYGAALPDALFCLEKGVINIVMLPLTAFRCLSAVITALFRQFISKRKLLEWVTAADSERQTGLSGVLINNVFSVLCAVFLFLFGSPYSYLCALLFLLNIPFEYCSARKIKKNDSKLDYLTKERMLSHAAAQWKYYEDYCIKEDNFLPPDNVQFSPVSRTAHRTSPTNIGLMLDCVLAARDLGFIDNAQMFFRIDKAISAVEKMEKWHGNLLNWYSTTDLKPLEPKYVSTVDSGNFLCSLIALKEGLKQYCAGDGNFSSLIKRIEKIIKSTDLKPLYNKKRQLFHIGFDLKTNALSDSYYDILMSEARLTSYFAVCTKAVPKKHWGALSRSLGRNARYAGPLSWSGTFFEYFMPNIFLPSKENTFSHEGLKFCLFCQCQYARKRKIPWGVSESAFFSFDSDYNYQYKAHGVGSLALCRTAENDTVVSPYSSYLALPFSPKKATVNIKRLERLHLLGVYALYEAADFTRDRIQSTSCAAVKSYMAHHIGMSLLSINNALNDFRLQKLFMSDADMAAGKSLLEERIPTGAPVFKRLYPENQKQKDLRRERFVKNEKSRGVRDVQAYSNGEWTLCAGADGVTRSTFLDRNIFRFDTDRILKPSGVHAVFVTDNNAVPFLPCLDRENEQKYSVSFSLNHVQFGYSFGDIRLNTRLSLHAFLPAERRIFTLQNMSKKAVSGELLIYFEPSLDTAENEKSHPAFSHLFLTGEYDRKLNALLFSRRGRSEKDSLFLACGFEDDIDFDYTFSRERALTRPDGIFSLGVTRAKDFGNIVGTPDCCGLISVKISLAPREKKSFPLLFSVARNKEEAKNVLGKLRDSGQLFKKEAGAIIEPLSESGVLSKKILPRIIFNSRLQKETLLSLNKSGKTDVLWSLGISGDRPIILCVIKDISSVAILEKVVKNHISYNRFFIKNDLVIAYTEDGTYSSPIRHEIDRMVSKADLNRVFRVNLFGRDEKVLDTLKAFCSFCYDGNETDGEGESLLSVKLLSGEKETKPDGVINNGYFIGSSPVLPWCFLYSNSHFGTLLSDKTLGFTFAFNSYLNRLTGWSNDTRTDFTDEKLIAGIGGKYFDIIKNCNVLFSVDKALYRCVCDGVEFVTEVRVPDGKLQKEISVFVKGNGEREIDICFCAVPILSENERNRRFIKMKKYKNLVTAENPMNFDYSGKMFVKTDGGTDYYIFDLSVFLSGNWDDYAPCYTAFPCLAMGRKIKLGKDDTKSVSFTLGFECNRQTEFDTVRDSIEIQTPDAQLNNLFNIFLPVQTVRGRIQARTGFYQCSGAYGFRDQLQDALSLDIICPEILRKQILLCASAQFPEGDVLHWFHLTEDGKFKGVRTRYSDDRLWLPFAVSDYVLRTGKRDILDIFVPFLEGEELKNGEKERYFVTESSAEGASVFEHCIRAIEKSLVTGANSLPLILGGDWNDGFNSVGHLGKGESVWLGEFLVIVLERFSTLCDEDRKKRYLEFASQLKKHIDKNAWKNGRYIRAFYDDGSPLGDGENSECKIDSLSQSFAVFCNMPDADRKAQALESAKKSLIDEKNGIVKLFDGGFRNDRRAGYISSYPVGLRENGGQYTHAAVWLAMAFFKKGDADTGYEILRILNPLSKYEVFGLGEKYMTEPYFLAGDVYSKSGVEGRGGWSIYTGSSGWYYKAVCECLFGIDKRADKVFISPALPSDWEKASLTLNIDGATYKINYRKNDRDRLTIDGETALFLTLDGKDHEIICFFSGK